MDELWQRYRTFWMPVLIGLGVFLVGLIAVHIMTDDPDQLSVSVRREALLVDRRVQPRSANTTELARNRDVLKARVEDWSRRLDQAHLHEPPLDDVVASALQAAILRGLDPATLKTALSSPDSPAGAEALARFDGDALVAGKALANYQRMKDDNLKNLKTGDPNVGFSQLLQDVWAELRTRANRADVELKTDVLGFGGVSSVSRQVLAQRTLNLALVAELVDLAVRSHAYSVDEVRLQESAGPVSEDAFLREWPFTIQVRGDMNAIRPLLEFLTNPDHPVPMTSLSLTQPPRGSPLEGQVVMQATVASVLVRPDAKLDLEKEEVRR